MTVLDFEVAHEGTDKRLFVEQVPGFIGRCRFCGCRTKTARTATEASEDLLQHANGEPHRRRVLTYLVDEASK